MLGQVFSITLMNLSAIRQRLGTSLVISVGIAGVVAVLVSVLAMATSLTGALTATGDPGRIIVVRKGALAESLSSLSREAFLAIESAPGIDQSSGRAALSPEVVLPVNLVRKDGGGGVSLSIRGLTDTGLMVRPEIKLLSGRFFRPGLYEVIVGEAAQRQVAGLEIGDSVSFRSNEWTVVGIFSTGGDSAESQLITDAATLMSAANRVVFNSATLRLADMDQFDALKTSIESNPQLRVSVERESDYYSRQSESIGQVLFFIAYVITAIMAAGALFGAVNTMYTAVSARTVEIATLRAIGFGATPIVVSVMAESLVLSIAGALVGGVIAWLLFNGDDFATGGGVGQIAVQIHVGWQLIATGTVWAITIGMLGALFPSIRAARVPVVEGLRVTA